MPNNALPHGKLMRLCAGMVAGVAATWCVAAGPVQAQQQARQQPRHHAVSDQEHARTQREQGQNRSFEELLRRASEIGRGQYLGVEPDISRNVYRFKFMRPGGNVVWVDIDGRSGRELAVRQ